MKKIYLDNAATTWPKPYSVESEMVCVYRTKSGNPGRGSHSMSYAASEIVYDCRAELSEMFGTSVENVVFTLNATFALNMAIKGLAENGCHILIDNFSHNAVLRPTVSLSETKGCTYDTYDASGDTQYTLCSIAEKLTDKTSIVVATHHSNICSQTLPIYEIGKFCRERGLIFIVDASQSAGHMKIDMRSMNIDALCFPGHKGLFGPMGVGVLILGEGEKITTLIEGGSGVESRSLHMPDILPERLEAGTLPLISIAGLLRGIRYVREVGASEIHAYESMLAEYFCEEISHIDGIKTVGRADSSVVSFVSDCFSPAEIGYRLDKAGICVRCGLHCAPLAHRTLGTENEGTVRVSFSYFNKPIDVKRTAEVLDGIIRG